MNALVRSGRSLRGIGRSLLHDAEGTACCCGPPGELRVIDPCITFLPNRCAEPPPGASAGDVIFYRESGGVYRCGTLTDVPCEASDSDAIAAGFDDCNDCEFVPCVEECDLICTADPTTILLGTVSATGSWTYSFQTSGGSCAFEITDSFDLSMSTMYVPGSDGLGCRFVRMPGSPGTECTPALVYECPDLIGFVVLNGRLFTPQRLQYDCFAERWEGVEAMGQGTPLQVDFRGPGFVPGLEPPDDPCVLGGGFVQVYRRTQPFIAGGIEPCAVGSYSEAFTEDRLESSQPFAATLTLSISSFTFDVVRIV